MANWVLKGLRTGVLTSPYPDRHDDSPGASPGRPLGRELTSEQADQLVNRCPAGVIARHDGGIAIEHGKCVHCFRCHPDAGDPAAAWEAGYEWADFSDDLARARHKLERV